MKVSDRAGEGPDTRCHLPFRRDGLSQLPVRQHPEILLPILPMPDRRNMPDEPPLDNGLSRMDSMGTNSDPYGRWKGIRGGRL